MLIAIFKRYSLKVIFVVGLLTGIQLPNFLAQYELRLDAHYIEAKTQLAQYQKLADFFFDGDIDALIQKHRDSTVPLFKAEVVVIENTLNRFNELQQEKIDLEGNLFHKFYFLVNKVGSPLFKETNKSYNAEIVLNQEAITVGLILALFFSLLFEMLFFFVPVLKLKVMNRQTKSKALIN